jgi:thioredoxin 1
MLITITDQDFEEKVLKSEKPILLDFFAVWCGPCKLAEPVLEELSSQHSDVVFAKLDVDQSPQTAQKFGVMSIPTTILFRNGQEVGRTAGFAGKKPYEDLLAKSK